MMCDLFYVGEWQQQLRAPRRAFRLNAHIFGFYAFRARRDDKRADAYICYSLMAEDDAAICMAGKCDVYAHNRIATLLR